MAISLPDARELSDEVLEAFRLRALRACEMGLSEGQVAELLGVARETVSCWWTAYQSGGLDALPHDRTGRPLGSGRLLTDPQGEHIQRLLTQHSPEDLGMAAPLWTRAAVRDLIHQECGVLLAVRTVGKYLARWGFTAKRPGRHARRQDPEEVDAWLNEVYPEIERLAAEKNAEIHWCDETGIAADHHPAVGYAPQGQPAILNVPDRHIRMNQISTITNEGRLRFMTYSQSMTTALFLVFLGRLLRSTTRKIYLIVDQLKAHRGPDVEAWVAAHPDRIAIFYLPCYGPELNADEYLNNDLKKNVNAGGLPNNRQELRLRIQQFMRRLSHLPQHVRNYFKHPCVLYALGSADE